MKLTDKNITKLQSNAKGDDAYFFPDTYSFEEVFAVVNELLLTKYIGKITMWNKFNNGLIVRFI